MDAPAPPIGPEAELRITMLQSISAHQWMQGDSPHRLIFQHVIANIANWDHSGMSVFSLGFPGMARKLTDAKGYIDLFCDAHSFLISLYDAIIPMGADVSVPVRTTLWMKYQAAVMDWVDTHRWPKPFKLTPPENNIIPKLQQEIDADQDIRHLNLDAEALSTPPKNVHSLSLIIAQDVMHKMASACYGEIKAGRDIAHIVNMIRPSMSTVLPLHGFLLFLAEACKRISQAVELHVDDHRQEYEEALAYLANRTEA